MQVTCLACDHRSNTVEPFWDLSLEFPERYHSNSRESAAQASCHLTEMLAKFTETEALEGNIYACDHCNCESVHMLVIDTPTHAADTDVNHQMSVRPVFCEVRPSMDWSYFSGGRCGRGPYA